MNLKFATEAIPEHMRESAREYVLHGRQPSHFLYTILQNDLVQAGRRADPQNARCLTGWARYLDNIPMAAWGSPEAVAEWIRRGGLGGES